MRESNRKNARKPAPISGRPGGIGRGKQSGFGGKTMEKADVYEIGRTLWKSVPGNILSEERGIGQECAGIRLYDAPLIGFGSADDPLFEEYKKPGVVGPWHMSPREWLPNAETVISFFFPASEEVRESNRSARQYASELWACARIEGQAYIAAVMNAAADVFRENGFSACVPSSDPRWQKLFAGQGITGYPEITETTFGSRWSERHAAYVCGLGTFGLSKGLITEKGVAGRFGSIVVSAAFEPDPVPTPAFTSTASGAEPARAAVPSGLSIRRRERITKNVWTV